MPKGFTLTPTQQTERRLDIMKAALNLFQVKGIEKTSMREIADLAGLGKSSLYDFFQSKDEIILYAVESQVNNAITTIQKIINTNLPPEQSLMEIMKINLAYSKEYNILFMWLATKAYFLNEEYDERIKKIRHTYQDIVQSVIEQGIKDGLFRVTDAQLASRLLINSMLSITYTSRPTHSMEDMLNEAVNIFLHGITL
ncbi:TetR/AcrR family transcriptional regulator [Enterocloster clostridioformis]|uniref:TetR/AcrR family transcriptional regulator n=1 Tax=Enterocloster clostridioformis TaxID=1531 RepID=UPI00080C87BB|nr:TetR/AcrR family transcriptional regulator [Enterocloster clostridioformis]ANU44625.1 TetR family transcriptional regulator [Lachnoclostridium sp. YL32]NDO28011.1 TetR/AcrR family transcriptional regulator [Enterocloster clostridioformis]OXE70465.1 TetR/AcrR family transcriptional regulator [Enterocloster clostridioformis]QQR00620.1 TetR/AcrR family transcriptional regulator [Enterocloster clostridioformis]